HSVGAVRRWRNSGERAGDGALLFGSATARERANAGWGEGVTGVHPQESCLAPPPPIILMTDAASPLPDHEAAPEQAKTPPLDRAPLRRRPPSIPTPTGRQAPRRAPPRRSFVRLTARGN